jgi:2-oxo-4-hydroxy-4-carboxy--5-ureidoimidazoline (OHCU) decarboxylase
MTPTRETLETLFERAPRFVDRLVELDASSWPELFEQAEQIALTMPEDEQVELLNSHPRIGAPPASVSALSYREQGYERDRGTAVLRERLDALNDDYEARFGFRFVIFVNGRSREEIADVMEAKLDVDRDVQRDVEKARALRDVIAIARSRAARLGEQ